MTLEYTPEQKSRLEIEKLHAEVVDLRSWVRRWLGGLGGLVGVITAAVSIVVASNQMRSSSKQAETKLQQADARLAYAERLESERLTREIQTQIDAKTKEIAAKTTQLKEVTDLLTVTQEKYIAAERATRSLVDAAKPLVVSAKALDLILESEGLYQPSRWPGGESGITLGIDYDLGFTTNEDFESDWKSHLSAEHIARLKPAIGLTGAAAKELAPKFADIVISREAAEEVFKRVTLPRHVARTAQVFPGFEKLPPEAPGALISLVYNRGIHMEGDRRREMRAIRDKVTTGDLQGIADEIRAMKKLWEGRGLDGLVNRREAEAALVESAIRSVVTKKGSP